MKKPKLTPWFPESVKPARPGVYNVSCRTSGQSGNWFARFNGEHWSPGWETDKNYVFPLSDMESNSDRYLGTWRGLAEKPKGEA